MDLSINKVLTLGNGENYLIVGKIIFESDDYLYIAQINETKTDILDNYKIVKITQENNKYYLDEIVGEEKLKKILPIFIESLS